MNKLKNTEQTGGYPLVMDDFRFMQDALREGFKAHLEAISRVDEGAAGIKRRLVFADDSDILIDASNSWTFPETYVYSEGELYRIPETVLNSSPAGYSYVLSLAISNDPNGTKTFQDATTHETHEIREGSLVREQFPAVGAFIVLKGSASGYTFDTDYLYRDRLNTYIGSVSPNMTTTQRDALTAPKAGQVVFNTTVNKHQGYDGTTWQDFY